MTLNSNTEHGSNEGFRPVHDIGVVLSFMTRLPIVVREYQNNGLARAAWAFPLAGLVVGGMGGGILYGFAYMGWSAALGVLLALTVMALITGALHEDGLADVADGFGGGETIARKLDIMRDSRIGSYGVLALVLATGLKAAALFELQDILLGAAALFSASVFSRAVLPVVMTALPHARDDGLSAMAGRPGVLVSMVSLALGCGFCLVAHADTAIVLIPIAASTIGTLLVMFLARTQIGGQTGDVIGATQQIAEIFFLVAMAIVAGGGS